MDMDLAELLTDPEMGAREFAYGRITESVNERGRAVQVEAPGTAVGIIQPAPGRECERLPEGDRNKSTIVIFTPEALIAGDGERKPDRVYWQDGVYRVALAEPWRDAGGYTKALAVLEEESE